MLVKLWGVRGSIATPLRNAEYREKLQGVLRSAIDAGLGAGSDIDAFIDRLPASLGRVYGGDTTCVTVNTRAQDPILIVDCGTGARALGDELMNGPCGRGEGEVFFFFTHTHWDHIQGLPFFKPLYIPGNVIHFCSPIENLESRLVRQQIDMFFPMPFEATASRKYFYTLKESAPFEARDGSMVDFFPLKHPGGSFAYRFRQGNKRFIFATDAEFTGQDLERKDDQYEFFEDADLLVMDAQYTLDDHFTKFDWGHTSVTMAVNCAVRWRVKNLALTHHEPSYTDARLLDNLSVALDHLSALGVKSGPRIVMAREGMQFQLGARQ